VSVPQVVGGYDRKARLTLARWFSLVFSTVPGDAIFGRKRYYPPKGPLGHGQWLDSPGPPAASKGRGKKPRTTKAQWRRHVDEQLPSCPLSRPSLSQPVSALLPRPARRCTGTLVSQCFCCPHDRAIPPPDDKPYGVLSPRLVVLYNTRTRILPWEWSERRLWSPPTSSAPTP
jgi:hypothetical protein